jgi:hypothetical protein
MHVLSTSQTIDSSDSLITLPCHFLVPITMESCTLKTNASVQVELNALCVVGRLVRCSSNNSVNGLK